MLSADEVRALAADLESDRIERTLSTTDTEKFREAICAFSNDLPGHGVPGYLSSASPTTAGSYMSCGSIARPSTSQNGWSAFRQLIENRY